MAKTVEEIVPVQCIWEFTGCSWPCEYDEGSGTRCGCSNRETVEETLCVVGTPMGTVQYCPVL